MQQSRWGVGKHFEHPAPNKIITRLLLLHLGYIKTTVEHLVQTTLIVVFKDSQSQSYGGRKPRQGSIRRLVFGDKFTNTFSCRSNTLKRLKRMILVQLNSIPFNLLCVLDLSSKHWQSTLFQIFFPFI